MAKENSFAHENELTRNDSSLTLETVPMTKKAFIEPEISSPVDVLEATTFFQAATSGGTN